MIVLLDDFFLSESEGVGEKRCNLQIPDSESFDGLNYLLVLVQSHRTFCFYQAETSNLLGT